MPSAPRHPARGAVAAVLAGLLLAVALGLQARGDPPPGGALGQRQEELRSLKEQIEETRRQTEKLRGEGRDVEQLLRELERQRGLTERYLGKLAAQEAEIEQEIARRQEDLSAREEAQLTTRDKLGRTLGHYYRERQVSAAELLLSARTFGEVFARAQYWVRAIRLVRLQLAEADRQRRELAEVIAGIDHRRREVQSLKEERQDQLARLSREELERRARRAELDRRIALFEDQARKLTASQREIERLIAEAQRAAAAGEGLAAQRGRLPWPVAGRIVTRFGTQIHPRYGTQVEQKGIEIAADLGAPIRSVAAGRVVFEGWLEGYGETVILDHGEGYFTLYAHAAEILVSRGARVEAGQMIARVGSTDSLQGACLHFEIRKGAQALDPGAWLRGEGPG
ncbi:MAG: peptidoglycan DD-metalloendopeptidase family protein [Candidatus Eisenbacteria bacterium]|uniref:Peptidoglycan DD-metalloendopeptidase family protein n=1 Tax=Eiseniibacteriota bacterium TaxID=2212470 RepID=A0A937XAE7_UNCEI|nr:peptidoglycan DD-metalloendopeptidase family protein [Candidatus Eisenbacteria bacterium]